MSRDAKLVTPTTLNEEILEQGLGKVSLDAEGLTIAKRLHEAEDRAKRQGLGIWKK